MENWQPLDEHLKNVSDLAGQFADLFKSGFWGKIADENHDFGKGLKEWQAWLRRVNYIEDEFSKYYSGHVQHARYCIKKEYDLYQKRTRPRAKEKVIFKA